LVADQPHLSRDLARVLVVGASTAWDPNGQEALDTAREALQIYRELPGPLDASDQDYFGAVALRVARAGFEAGRLDEAGDAVHDAVEQLERCADRSPNDHGGWYALALALLARHHVSRDDLVKARQAVALGAALVIALPADVKGKTEAEDALFALRADIDG
jgi:hypothetical protein